MLTPSYLLLPGASLQLAGVLLCWLIAETRLGLTAIHRTSPLQLQARAVSRGHVLQLAPIHLQQPVVGRRARAGNAMIERDAA